MLLCITVSDCRQCSNRYVSMVGDSLLCMRLSYVCNFWNWCVINSHEQNIQFLHDSLQEQLEHHFGHIYFLVVSWLFPLFLVCFVLGLCWYLHNNLAQVYMSCVLTFWHQSMKYILLCFHGKLCIWKRYVNKLLCIKHSKTYYWYVSSVIKLIFT